MKTRIPRAIASAKSVGASPSPRNFTAGFSATGLCRFAFPGRVISSSDQEQPRPSDLSAWLAQTREALLAILAGQKPSILPPLSPPERLEGSMIQSIAGLLDAQGLTDRRPFRAPHHSASMAALVGGGAQARPGEVSLAHHGVLFLDELPEFDRRVLEVLREPLESGRVSISRAARQAEFPARFQLVAAMNPCPCGYLGHPSGRCRCTPDQEIGRAHV